MVPSHVLGLRVIGAGSGLRCCKLQISMKLMHSPTMDVQAHVEAEIVLWIAASQAKVCAGRHCGDSARERHAEPGTSAACVGAGTLLLHWHREQDGTQWPDRMRDHWPADGGVLSCPLICST